MTRGSTWVAWIAFGVAIGLGWFALGQVSDGLRPGRQFALQAASGGQMMVTLGRKAQMQGFDPAVKRYARRVVDDHRNAMNDLPTLREHLQRAEALEAKVHAVAPR